MGHYASEMIDPTPFISRKELDLASVKKKAEKILKSAKLKGQVTKVTHEWQTDTPKREWIEIYYEGTYNKQPQKYLHVVDMKLWKMA